ncbi:cysteine-rich secretory protein LCCL domain-containing 2-like [Mytilus trossulus]|uniref:cysteine-rich secretory protein LCCL domain-containing 2-like n=1 Tax=Mytilus trossulus TaxID=6551 RepID=UPI003004EE40
MFKYQFVFACMCWVGVLASRDNIYDRLLARLTGRSDRRQQSQKGERGIHLVGKPSSIDYRTNSNSKRSLGTPLDFSIDEILSLHNTARYEVSPPANPPIPDLIWNNELAKMAEEWAKGCLWGHNPNRTTSLGTLSAGENIALTSEISQGFNNWEDEITDWTYDNYKDGCDTGKTCGHYTQIIWAKTTKIGCAYVKCDDYSNLPDDYNPLKYLVCDYFPPGNMRYNNVYQKPYE